MITAIVLCVLFSVAANNPLETVERFVADYALFSKKAADIQSRPEFVIPGVEYVYNSDNTLYSIRISFPDEKVSKSMYSYLVRKYGPEMDKADRDGEISLIWTWSRSVCRDGDNYFVDLIPREGRSLTMSDFALHEDVCYRYRMVGHKVCMEGVFFIKSRLVFVNEWHSRTKIPGKQLQLFGVST